MNTEILKDILEFTDDKQNTIVYFLKPHIQKQLLNYYFYDKSDNDIFIDHHIILIKKNNLHLEDKGIIISISRNKIGLCINSLYNKYYNMDNYYIFIKNRNKKISEREIMESLLKKL
tara:strand:- start:144 stop:494 length:351 start_codon:yes stop_codon:yes gene_type:complete